MSATDIFALYGAILSTAVFLWTWQRARGKVLVELTNGLGFEDEQYTVGVSIEVRNSSEATIHVSHVSFLTRHQFRSESIKKRILYCWEHKRLPRTLGWVQTSLTYLKVEEGHAFSLGPMDAHNIFVPDRVVADVVSESMSRLIRVVVEDKLRRKSYSKILKLEAKRVTKNDA